MHIRAIVTSVTVALGLVVLLGGCISVGIGGDGEEPDMRFHTLEPPAPVKTTDKVAEVTLSVSQFGALERYDVRVVRRLPEGTVRFLEYERWADSPDQAVSVAVREALAAGGAFARVADATTLHPSTHSLDGHILVLDLISSPSGPWQARFRVRLDLVPTGSGEDSHSGVFEATRPLPGSGPDGLGPAMTACVADVVAQAVAAWRQAGVLR